ncbi:MAG: pantetheine-phosphate adenylyltransferase [Spirochaetota bacterium]|nr:MAG: pantetheine-phosphate adenylyltransferase [Spirochaetota bacterium]
MIRKTIYPGSFDPPTNGHCDIISRSAKIFDRLIVAVGANPEKKYFFSLEERIEMLREIVSEYDNIEVAHFDGLLVEYAAKVNAVTIIRGLRALSDFEYELELALMNRHLNSDVDTIFMMTDERYSFIRSSLVREVAKLGGDISDKVPKVVENYLKKKFS